MSEIISTIGEEEAESGGFWGGGAAEQGRESGEPFPESVDPFSKGIENQDSRFTHNSIEEVVNTAGADDKGWDKVAESSGGDILQKESQGREWLYKDESGERASVTGSQEIGDRHQEILTGLYDQGFFVSEYQKPDSDILVKEIYFADEKGNIFYQVFEKQAGIEQNKLIDDGDGLDDTILAPATGEQLLNVADLSQPEMVETASVEQATLQAVAPETHDQNLSQPEMDVFVATEQTAIETSLFEIDDQPLAHVAEHNDDLDLIPPPLRGEDKGGGDERGLIALDFSLLPNPRPNDRLVGQAPPQGEGKQNTESSLEFDDLELPSQPSRTETLAAPTETIVVEEISQGHLFIDARGYEVQHQPEKEDEKKPDIFELTKTEKFRDKIEPYLRERERHLEISISPDSANGLTVIDNPTEAEIHAAVRSYEQDLRNEELYGGLSEEAFETKKHAVELDKEQEEEEIRLMQEQNRRMEKRSVFLEEEEEEESWRSLLEMRAAAGEAVTTDSHSSSENLNRQQNVSKNIEPQMEAVKANSETLKRAEDREDNNSRETLIIERETGIRAIVVEDTRSFENIPARAVETARDGSEYSRKPEALILSANTSAELRLNQPAEADNLDSGIKIVFDRGSGSSAILAAQTERIAPVQSALGPRPAGVLADDTGREDQGSNTPIEPSAFQIAA